VSAFDSAFLRRPRRNSADFLGQRALETPNCFPVGGGGVSFVVFGGVVVGEGVRGGEEEMVWG